MNAIQKLTNGEEKIMRIFWDSNQPLSAREVARSKSGINQNLVQAVLRKLVAKKFVKVSGITYSRTVLTRQYEPAISEEDYYSFVVSKSTFKKLFAHFVSQDSSKEELKEMTEMMEKKLKELDSQER
ncbi:BlaI/MecI/CopY family transcriptional regulator [Xylocopilactobacillus apis]|nr:BlaI/MecI/CopY family transcriptional regulator [Xylocopilactobacillus apis]